MTLAQLGAEVIRIDPMGGNIDVDRWPLAPGGASIYWASLNKAKRSETLPLETEKGQRLATELICGSGIVLTNLPARGWMNFERLRTRRPDLIMVRLIGNPDGSGAVDYTVNCASGFPGATGAAPDPVNHVLPAWDVAAGLYLALGVLTAERVRRQTGMGQEVVLSLADVMLATVGNLGYIGDVQVNGAVREPIGNHLYGAFGHDFATEDGRRIMLVAISNRQWRAIGRATGLAAKLAMIGPLWTLTWPPKAAATKPGMRSRPCWNPGSRGTRSARSAPRSTAAACSGAPTRISVNWSPRTQGARPPTRSSPGSSSPASARSSHLAYR